jgi:hypothetical protein
MIVYSIECPCELWSSQEIYLTLRNHLFVARYQHKWIEWWKVIEVKGRKMGKAATRGWIMECDLRGTDCDYEYVATSFLAPLVALPAIIDLLKKTAD